MANKARVTDAQVEAANEIYKVAREQADGEIARLREEMDAVRQESFAMGAIKAIDANIAYNEFLKLMTIYRIKQQKDYKHGGMTWEQFCDANNITRRTIDLIIDEVKPVFESFSANLADLCGMPINKIRLLGRSVSANLAEIRDNAIVYGDEIIPLTPDHADDIQALIERINEDTGKIKDELTAQKKAFDRVQADTRKSMVKLQKDLDKLTKEARKKDISPEEDAILGRIEALGVELNGHCLAVENVFDALRENPFPSAVAAFIGLMDNIRMRTGSFRDGAVEHAPSGMLPDEEWTPPPLRQVVGD